MKLLEKTFAALSLFSLSSFFTLAYAVSCSSLVGSISPPTGAVSAEITAANVVAANDPIEPTGVEHCKITGVIHVAPSDPGSRITFLLRMPASGWNQKLIQAGQGDLGTDMALMEQGLLSVNFSTMWPALSALRQGYATVVDDTGHQLLPNPLDGSWAFVNNGGPGGIDNQRKINYGGFALHLTNLTAKKILQQFYQNTPAKSYYIGCSLGGLQGYRALSEYPNDYQGAIIGTPAKWVPLIYTLFWQQKLLRELSSFSKAQLELVTNKVLEKCDNVDGIQDGILNDPRQCTNNRFSSLAHLPLCLTHPSDPNCFTLKQVAMLEALYSGPIALNGSHGLPKSSEAPFGPLNSLLGLSFMSWDPFITSITPLASTGAEVREFLRYFIYNNPNLDWEKYLDKSSLLKIYADVSRGFSGYDVSDPALIQYKKKGGKVIFYTGWMDPVFPAEAIIDLYQQIAAGNGGSATNFAKLYLQPGTGHCGVDGVGPQMFNALGALEQWVEQGTAPQALTAFTIDAFLGGPLKSRPLCPYPKVAKIINPQGNIFDASNFSCVNP